jgi:hypothetical protein
MTEEKKEVEAPKAPEKRKRGRPVEPLGARMQEFPIDILVELKQLVARGVKADRIRTRLRELYKGSLTIPNVQSIKKWVQGQLAINAAENDTSIAIRREMEYTDSQLRELQGRLNIGFLDIGDRKKAMETVVNFILARVQVASQIQGNLMDPRYEAVMAKHLEVIHKYLETILKLEGQLGLHEYVARLIVEQYLTEVAPIMRKAFEDTVGQEKFKAFVAKFTAGVKTIDFERIKNESVNKAIAFEKGEINV